VSSAACPYCGEPNADHFYVSRGSCVIARDASAQRKPVCPNCHGAGVTRFGVCTYCKGSGRG
jgi:DnaJ-class molecular chaperone